MARAAGLGRGLGSLIPASPAETIGGLEEIPVGSVYPNRFQPRTRFDEEDLAALAESIREVGILQPILVRPSGDGYELVAGERRWRAARRVGLQFIPALVRDADDASALERALVENVHRADLNALEEAAAYQQLIEDFHLTHEQVAQRVGRSRVTISNTLRLLQLPPSVQRMVRDGLLGNGHARALLGSPDRQFQEALAKRVASEDLSVRATEAEVRHHEAEPVLNGGSGIDPAVATHALRPPGLLELEQALGDYLETRVSVAMGAHRGRVVVEFSTLEDLERIYRAMTAGS